MSMRTLAFTREELILLARLLSDIEEIQNERNGEFKKTSKNARFILSVPEHIEFCKIKRLIERESR